MIAELQITDKAGKTSVFGVDNAVTEIGSGGNCQVHLPHEDVGRIHARLVRNTDTGKYFVFDLGMPAGTHVNGERVVRYGPIAEIDVIGIGPFRMKLAAKRRSADTSDPAGDFKEQAPRARRGLKAELLNSSKSVGASVEPDPHSEEMARVAREVHRELFVALDLRRNDVARMSDQELRDITTKLIAEILPRHTVSAAIDRKKLADYILHESVGLGPLEELLRDDAITEVMVNGARDIFAERGGKLQRLPVTFSSDKSLYGVIERIVAPIGRRVDESSPLVDARLQDGSRVNIIIPPLALKGPTITIRKFSKKRLQISDLLKYQSVSEPMVEFLQICVEHKKNVIVSGGTGSGKTTLLNVLSNLIPPEERIVTIEDAAELRLHHDNLVTLEARPKNTEGKGEVAIRELVKNSLRMRPDRIVVGECRGGEALDMLQAMNTGHDGSLTTAHANTPRDLLSRLEVMVLMAGMDLPVAAIREQIASAVNIIVQQTRFACGTRKVTRIVEITGVEGGTIQQQDVFRFQRTGFGADGKIEGYFTGCGYVPTFYEELRKVGVDVDVGIFDEQLPGSMAEAG
jgi:pilus assembly protein CpaF